MNEIYAVDPAAPKDGEELMNLVRLFGPTEGRFLYDFPCEWLNPRRPPKVLHLWPPKLLHLAAVI